jgi:heme exporter protein D
MHMIPKIIEFGPHADFIIAAYAVTVLAVGALIAWVVFDHAEQQRILGDLEKRGATRRSQQPRKGKR